MCAGGKAKIWIDVCWREKQISSMCAGGIKQSNKCVLAGLVRDKRLWVCAGRFNEQQDYKERRREPAAAH